jgi:acyl carrier protein phosphodiesterase
MNWLAHLVLSESSPAFRVGNVLADILPIGELRALPDTFQAGVLRHRAIDSFTDRHPVFRRSVARLEPPFRRYGGVVIDVFYDHLLTASWTRHSELPLAEFVAQFHSDVESCRSDIPHDAYVLFDRMRAGSWLTSYSDLAGVRTTLDRIARRLRRPFDLGASIDELDRHYGALSRDFSEFFPEITARFGVTGR